MNQFIIKKFHKKEAVKCFILYPEKRIKIFWAIPKNKIVQIKGSDLSFIVNDKDFFIHKGIPSYIYDINNVQPKNPYEEKTFDEITPFDFDTAISSKVAREVLEALGGSMDKATISIIIGIVIIGVVGVGIYILGGKLDGIIITVNEILEKLKILGGF